MDYITVKISKEKFLEDIRERFEFWGDKFDKSLYALLEQHFSDLIDDGVFNGTNYSVMDIVDNALINDFGVEYENGKALLINKRGNEVVGQIDDMRDLQDDDFSEVDERPTIYRRR